MADSETSSRSNARRIVAILLFLAIAVTAGLLLHQTMNETDGAPGRSPALNVGYRHSERLKVATARAAMDVLGMNGYGANAENFRSDYHRQRLQIQADSEGLERWAANDVHHQGLLREIRVSLAALTAALDQASGTSTVAQGMPKIPLLPALDRAERAFSNYSSSLTESPTLERRPHLFSGPLLAWWLLVLLLVEAAALAWLAFSAPARAESASDPSR